MKRGQVDLSFGMIFSIIIIIITIGIAIYFIQQFLSTSKCAEVNLFRSDLQNKVDSVWKSPQARETFSINLPTSIEEICIGNITSKLSNKYSQEYLSLRRFQLSDSNLFILPIENACGGNAAKGKLNHIINLPLFCIKLDKGKGSLKIVKESSSQTLVNITPSS